MRRRSVVAAFQVFSLVFLCTLFPGPCRCADLLYELKLGVLDHDVSGLWSGYKLENGDDINAELVFSPSRTFLKGQLRPNLGISINTEGYTSEL